MQVILWQCSSISPKKKHNVISGPFLPMSILAQQFQQKTKYILINYREKLENSRHINPNSKKCQKRAPKPRVNKPNLEDETNEELKYSGASRVMQSRGLLDHEGMFNIY